MLTVEVVYANETGQALIALEVIEGSTVFDAIVHSDISTQFPDIDCAKPAQLNTGIFSKKVELDRVLQDGDRVEIYRELTIDPKTRRRLLAERKKTKG